MKITYSKAVGLTFLTVGAGLLIASAPGKQASDTSTPLATVKRLYAAFEKGDMPAIPALIAPDATWTYYGPSSILPFAGTRKGPDGVNDFFREVDRTLGDATASQREMIVAGDTVVVPGWEESTVKATGGHYKVANVHLFKVRNGKITQFEEYIDSGTVVQAFQPADPVRGQAFYTTCAGCHGTVGEGRPTMHAPRLAGLDATYLVRQLRNFRAGVRGKTADFFGYQMVGRANALPDDRALRDVASYIDSLPTKPPVAASPNTAAIQAGRKSFETCAACHGAHGEGNPEAGAPALRGAQDWYVRIQLANFRSGLRGTDPKDVGGAQMRTIAQSTPPADDAGLAAYISSLHD